jgi:uncharacterized protein (TIGR03435 family)
LLDPFFGEELMRRALLFGFFCSFTTLASARQAAPAFEVVSIKPAQFPSTSYFEGFAAGAGACGFSQFTPAGPRVSFGTTTVCSLIRMAYDIKDYQVVSMPTRMAGKDPSSWYQVEARAAADVVLTVEQARLMLQTMLADRFKLKFHREPRQAPVYALVVARDGHKLGTADKACAETRMTFLSGPGTLRSCNPGMAMSRLVFALSRELDRPVVDRTGLTGTYAFSLTWAPREPLAGTDDRPSLFTAVQEQLGLRLEPSTDAVDAFIIDSVEPPAPN